jgi:hypothetical protein
MKLYLMPGHVNGTAHPFAYLVSLGSSVREGPAAEAARV